MTFKSKFNSEDSLGSIRKMFFLALVPFVLVMGCGKGFDAQDLKSLNKPPGNESPTPTPVPTGVPEIPSWSAPFPAGKHDPNCMTNPDYNICLIYKDPVSANGAAFSPVLTPATSNATIEQRIMTYGLKVPTQGPLSNSSYTINDSPKAQPNSSGSWKFPYQGDTNHYVAQIQAFYWLNRQLTFMKEQTGKFYHENRGCKVTAYSSSTQNNAYYNGKEIVLGYRNSGGSTVNVGLDAGVIAHEAGHGNLDKALRSQGSYSACPTKNGCIAAIHEGQGDVHTFLLFPDKGSTLGNYFMNSTSGLRDPASIKKRGLTAPQIFSESQGQQHSMGQVYSSIWWEVWYPHYKAATNKDIEILFTNHLGGLFGTDNFSTALEVIRTMAKQAFPQAKADQIIDQFETEYTRLGVTIP